ncbi:ParB family protein [Pseudomonas sp. B15(2017)]|uniref:ParB family protein n=1 Tax=Pseudomonas sp. B15(2017) TaxID=1981744 RepID=UPI000A1D9925|nr:ParB family protein [Pseudomonas sp. B15(2017)]
MSVSPQSTSFNKPPASVPEVVGTRQSHVMADPEVDTPMIVTLDQLSPYDLNPRVTRNPKYDEIKASIRERGLDAPPPITRRPGEHCFRIRNGGNTRLSILRELWSETRNDRYFHLSCLFRPWSKRGEILALTGHLAENELRGGLTFIERALGVEKAKELYEQECGTRLSQSELSRRLTADGYPVQQSHISRMRDAVDFLLPAIPNVLYAGLGRHQVERLAVMRRSYFRIWEKHVKGKSVGTDFSSLFHDVLLMFDDRTCEFNSARVEDEIVGQMAEFLGMDYDTLVLESESSATREQALMAAPPSKPIPEQLALSSDDPGHNKATLSAPEQCADNPVPVDSPDCSIPKNCEGAASALIAVEKCVSGESSPAADIHPFSQGSLFPISDIWDIEPDLDEPKRLRTHISQFAREICQDMAKVDLITEVDEGIGFRCDRDEAPDQISASSLVDLLQTLTTGVASSLAPVNIGPLLVGSTQSASHSDRLSDASLVKLFRLIRLARRLIDHKSEAGPTATMYSKEDV